jgi:hypothetical protein
MHSIDGTFGARALKRNGTQLARRARKGVASLRPATLDAIIIAIFSAILFSVEYFYDLAPQLFQFAIEYRDLEIDNLIFVVFVMSIGFAIFSYRRMRELAVEMKARRFAELEAKKLARHDPLTELQPSLFRRSARRSSPDYNRQLAVGGTDA